MKPGSSYWKSLVLGLVAAVVVACGGGGGNAGDPLLGGGGGGTEGTAEASDLTITLSANVLTNSGSETVTATVTAVDGNRNTVPGIPITISVNSGATVAVSDTLTDTSGVVTGVIGIGESKLDRVVTVRARSGNVERTASLQIGGTQISSTVSPAVLDPGQDGSVFYTVRDSAGAAMSGVVVNITGVPGQEREAVSDSSGEVEYAFSAPTTAGNYEIRATIAGVAPDVEAITVLSGQNTIDPVTDVIRSSSVSASPSVVSANTLGSVVNSSEVRALFLGDANKPIANVRVRFDLDGDPNSIGGTFDVGTNQLYSGPNGVVTAKYRPGSIGSPTNGVIVRACWDYNDFAAGACPNAARTTLTVAAEPLSVTIGTDATVSVGATGLTYVKRYVVQVVDASGLAKPDITISPAIDLLQYRKGEWVKGVARWEQVPTATCDNEDLNRNGIAETYSNGGVEDANGSAALTPARSALEPRKADVGVSFEGSNKTNTQGQLVLRVEYPQSLGSWVRFDLVVAASGIGGTEGRTSYTDWLPVLASEVNDLESDVPFHYSPYGTQASPTVFTQTPDGLRSGLLCTNPN